MDGDFCKPTDRSRPECLAAGPYSFAKPEASLKSLDRSSLELLAGIGVGFSLKLTKSRVSVGEQATTVKNVSYVYGRMAWAWRFVK